MTVNQTRLKSLLYWLSATGITLLILAELILRFGFGFGNPPLLMAHPTIEYLYKPSANYQLMGNRFLVNEYGMRSDSFPATRQGNKLRILMIGDSILNGGRRIDQSLLASEQIKTYYTEQLDVPVIVANISAASWSAPNQLAYLNEYGLFDADLAIIMQNAADIMIDYPSFVELHPIEQPTKAPPLALIEIYNKVIRPRIAPKLGLSEYKEVFGEIPDGRTNCRLEIEKLLEKLQSNDITCMHAC